VRRRITTLLFLSFGALSFGCLSSVFAPDPLYGPEYNEAREKIGLPVIPSDWTVIPGSEESNWYKPNWQDEKNRRIPVHSSKYINYPSGALVYETDHYYGPGDWNCEGDICREQLFITYCYQADSQCNDTKGWFITYMSAGTTGFGREFISLEEAKKVLDSWGLSYP